MLTKMTNAEMETLEATLEMTNDTNQQSYMLKYGLMGKEITQNIINRFYPYMTTDVFSSLDGLSVEIILNNKQFFDPDVFAEVSNNIDILLDSSINAEFPNVANHIRGVQHFAKIKNHKLTPEMERRFVNSIRVVLPSEIDEYNDFINRNIDDFNVENILMDEEFDIKNLKPSTIISILGRHEDKLTFKIIMDFVARFYNNEEFIRTLLLIGCGVKEESYQAERMGSFIFSNVNDNIANELFRFVHQKNKMMLSYSIIKQFIKNYEPDDEFYSEFKDFLFQNGIRKEI